MCIRDRSWVLKDRQHKLRMSNEEVQYSMSGTVQHKLRMLDEEVQYSMSGTVQHKLRMLDEERYSTE